jgi:hypothetical protein
MASLPAGRQPYARRRLVDAIALLAVIACGLVVRSEFLALPAFFAKYAGDALWALMVFLGLGFVFVNASTLAVAGMAATVCGIVETSQLYHADWLDALRRTWLGRMTLGNAFGWGDLAAYGVGIVVGGAGEWMVRRVTEAKTWRSL